MTTPSGVLFNDPRAKPTSAAGLAQPGAYYQYYLTQTTTPATVYKDGALTIPAVQTPGTGDTTLAADGRMIPIYLNPAIIYRVQLYSAIGVLLEDTDPYVVPITTATSIGQLLYPQTAAELAASVTPTNYTYPPYNVLRYGADPTGVSSSLTAFNSAYNAAMAASPHAAIYAPAGTYLIPAPGLTWTNQNDIRFYGDGPNSTVLKYSGSNYTVLTISADTGAGTTGTNLVLQNFGIAAVSGATGVSALSLADYLFFYLSDLQLYGSGNGLKMAGMASGVCDNLNCLTAGTNAAGNAALLLTSDSFNVTCGPLVFNGGSFNGQSNVTIGGAVWSKGSFSTIFNGSLFTAFGSALTSVFAATNNDDITIIGGYTESARNTLANTANLFDLGATAAPQNFTLIGGTYFAGASGHTLNYGIKGNNVQALNVINATFAGFATAAIIYTTTAASMIKIENTYSSGAGSPPVLDASINGPASAYLKSWEDPWPRVDASFVAGVTNATGDGTAYTVLFDTKNFDTTAMYNTGTGIATVGTQLAGMYDVSAAVMVNGVTGAAWTNYEMDIIQKTAGGATVSVHAVSTNPGAVRNAANQASLAQSCLLKCSAGDQIYVQVSVSGSTKTVGVVGSSTEYSRLCIRYLG